MATLNSSYQYIGRSTGVKAVDRSFYFYLLLYAKTEGSTATGKHRVYVKMRLACSANSTFYDYDTTANAKVAGQTAISWSNKRIPGEAWGSGSITEGGVTYPRYTDLSEGYVDIDTDYAAKDVVITASWQRLAISTTPPGWLPSTVPVEASITVTLPQIPSTSTITSVANVTLGNKCNVKWTPKSASFRYRLGFSLGNWSETTDPIHPNTTAEYTYTGYTIPLEAASQIPNNQTGKMTVTLYSYSDSSATSQIGSGDTKEFTVTVPDNEETKPSVTMVLSPEGSLPSAFDGLYIQGVSRLKATLSATGKYGADIKSLGMMVESSVYDAEDEYTSDYLISSGTKTVYGHATDKREYTGETSQEIEVIPYGIPKLESVSAIRCDQNGNATEDGGYLKISAKRSYSPVMWNNQQKNFCSIMYRYYGSGSYSEWYTILSGDSMESDEVVTDALLDGALSDLESYIVQVRVIDDIGGYAEAFITIPTAMVYWHRDGARNALGLGKYNERENALDSAWDFYMNGHKVTGLSDPVGDTDAVTFGFLKQYIDSRLAKLTSG